MSSNTKVEWADNTFNPWWGCTHAGPECEHCYAEGIAARFAPGHWGKQGARRFYDDEYWDKPRAWDRRGKRKGTREKVFCASMADVFERLPGDHPNARQMADARLRLWRLIHETQNLDWLLLTKRAQNVRQHWPWSVGKRCYLRNAWVGATVGHPSSRPQLDHLRAIDAAVRFLSCEPLLAPVDLDLGTDGRGIDWVIVGGMRTQRRCSPMDPEWACDVIAQCERAGVPVFFKQYGSWVPEDAIERASDRKLARAAIELDGGRWMLRVGKRAASRRIKYNGRWRTFEQFPKQARMF